IVLPLDRWQPLEAGRIVKQVIILATGSIDQAMAEMDCHRLVHPRLAVAIGADEVVPPLVTRLVRDEVVNVGTGQVRHAEDALVDNDQRRTLVAVPAKKGLDDGELRIGIRTDPLAVVLDGRARRLDHASGMELVLRESETANAYGARLAAILLITGTAQE